MANGASNGESYKVFAPSWVILELKLISTFLYNFWQVEGCRPVSALNQLMIGCCCCFFFSRLCSFGVLMMLSVIRSQVDIHMSAFTACQLSLCSPVPNCSNSKVRKNFLCMWKNLTQTPWTYKTISLWFTRHCTFYLLMKHIILQLW